MPKATVCERCLGFDTASVVSPDNAYALFKMGFSVAFRYGPLPGVGYGSDLSSNELTTLLNTGLMVQLVQHVRYNGWLPSAKQGTSDAQVITQYAQSIGYLQGCHIWYDREGVSTASSADFKDDIVAWATVIEQAGYLPGLYIGAQANLSGKAAYSISNVYCYMRAANLPSLYTPSPRGWAVKQLWDSITVNDLTVDVDAVLGDNFGGMPTAMYYD